MLQKGSFSSSVAFPGYRRESQAAADSLRDQINEALGRNFAECRLHLNKVSSFSRRVPTASGLGMSKKVGGDTTRTADLK